MVALSRTVARKAAMEMLLTGEAVDAAEAARLGLINRAVPAADLDAAVAELAGSIAARSPLTVAMGKAAFQAQLDLPLSEAYAYAGRVMTANMLAGDAAEGIDAFLEKRPPVWRDL
jgi:enoyl-CoA hydratase/carnithine racemase